MPSCPLTLAPQQYNSLLREIAQVCQKKSAVKCTTSGWLATHKCAGCGLDSSMGYVLNF